jgi:hypothetical protein
MGTILMLINQADVLLTGHASALVVAKIGLTYLVPFRSRRTRLWPRTGLREAGLRLRGYRLTPGAALAILFLAGCNALLPGPKAIECPPLPDANQALAQAWQAYQPDQSMSLPVTLRRRLFAFQALLLSAGMYDDQAPAAPSGVYADYAPQFVRDLGMSRNPGLADALKNLDRKLNEVRQEPDSKLGANCGLILARRALREDPTNVSTDWILQTVTWGFAAYFQSSVRQLIHEHAQTCSGGTDVGGSAEAILDCTIRRVGL